MVRVNTYYERAYETSIGVPDIPTIFRNWEHSSDDARKTLTCYLDESYGSSERETVDIFPATQRSNRWLIFIHGGYWRAIKKDLWSFLAVPFVQAGYNVAIVEYDLCPHVTIGTITEQIRNSIVWLVNHASDYNLDCDEIIISGHSAGGHLTAMMFATNWNNYNINPAMIKGGIAISGIYDLEPMRQTERNADLQLTTDDIENFSPIHLTPKVNAPLVVVVGSKESAEFLRQGMLLKCAPGWDNVASDVIIATDYHHFDILDLFMDMNSIMWKSLS